jgi:hypothetical protein
MYQNVLMVLQLVLQQVTILIQQPVKSMNEEIVIRISLIVKISENLLFHVDEVAVDEAEVAVAQDTVVMVYSDRVYEKSVMFQE